MSRGLGRVQKLILQHLQTVEHDTIRGIIHFLYTGTELQDKWSESVQYVHDWIPVEDRLTGIVELRRREVPVMPEWPKDARMYGEKEHWTVCRALLSLERRGLVERRQQIKHERTRPLVVWGLPKPSITNGSTGPTVSNNSETCPTASPDSDSKQHLASLEPIRNIVLNDKTSVEIGDIHMLYGDDNVRLQLVGCDPEEQTPLERKLGHRWRVEVDCSFNDTSFSTSGKTSRAAIIAALEKLKGFLQR